VVAQGGGDADGPGEPQDGEDEGREQGLSVMMAAPAWFLLEAIWLA
jgi:hypothetical protein